MKKRELISCICDQTIENIIIMIITLYVNGLAKSDVKQTTDYKTFSPEFELYNRETYIMDILLC